MNALTGQPSAFRIVERPLAQQEGRDPTPISSLVIELPVVNDLIRKPSAFRIGEGPVDQQDLLDSTSSSVPVIDLTEQPTGQLVGRVSISPSEEEGWETTRSKCALLSVILISAVAFSGATYAAVHVNAGFAALAGVSGMTGVFMGIFYVKIVFFS